MPRTPTAPPRKARPAPAGRSPAGSGTRAGSARERAALHGWLLEHARPFDGGRGPAASVLGALRARLDGARVLLLHETAANAAETVLTRVAVLRALAGQGFTQLGMDCAPAYAAAVQRYLGDGDRKALAALGAHATGSAGAAVLFFGAWRRAQRLRAGLQPFGYGAAGDAAMAYGELDRALAARAAATAAAGARSTARARVDDLRRLLAPVPQETADGERERLEWALDWMDLQFAPLTDALGSDGYAELRNLMSWLHAERLGAGGNEMAEAQLAFALAERWPESRAVLLAGDATAPGMHDFVTRTLLPGRSFTLWCVHGGGTTGRRTRGRTGVLKVPAGSLNARLAAFARMALDDATGRAFVLPLAALDDPRAAPLREPQVLVAADGATRTVQLDPAQALCFLPTVHEMA